jgi:hypothetical protein
MTLQLTLMTGLESAQTEGFIDSFADAVHITRNLKATGAETAIWEPWLIEQYGSDVAGN